MSRTTVPASGRSHAPLTLSDLSERERARLNLCIHEAGHAVAGVLLGGELHNAVVTHRRVHDDSGLTTFADRPPGRDPEIAYSGPWSEARFAAGGRPTRQQVMAVLHNTGHRDDRVLLASGGLHAGHTITPLLEMAWPAVIRTAQQLWRTGEATHDDVLKALGVDDGGGPGSTQLANLRAGLRAVTPLP